MEQLRETVFQKIYLLIPAPNFSCCTIWSESEVFKLLRSSCVIIFNAGGSGTRLYLYTSQGSSWRENNKGPRVSPLTGPVREIRSKTWIERKWVTSEIATAFDLMADLTYDWKSKCELSYVAVYTTEGTWLAAGNTSGRENFGFVEMGGASVQITFSCSGCYASIDCLRTIFLDKKEIDVFSYSFLGLGKDRSPVTQGFPPSCRYGAGEEEIEWTVAACNESSVFQKNGAIIDPYNFTGKGQGT